MSSASIFCLVPKLPTWAGKMPLCKRGTKPLIPVAFVGVLQHMAFYLQMQRVVESNCKQPAMRTLFAISLLAGVLCTIADTWVPPVTEIVHSRDGNIVVRIDPVTTEDSKKAAQRPVATITKWVTEERGYRFIRRVTLLNQRCPLTALITNDARFLVTFDDWFGVGTTDNTIVIYDLQYGTTHNHRLDSFLPAFYREKLRRSVSSISWHGEPFVDEWEHTIYVPLPDTKPDRDGFEPHLVIDPAKNKVWLQTKDKPK